MPRLFRQSPVNGVWEGSGNVICLDVLRALAREPEALDAYWAEVARADGGDRRLTRAVDDLHVDLSATETLEARARSVVERMALVFQASLLVRFAPGAVADAFCRVAASRGGRRGLRHPSGRDRHERHPGPAHPGLIRSGGAGPPDAHPGPHHVDRPLGPPGSRRDAGDAAGEDRAGQHLQGQIQIGVGVQLAELACPRQQRPGVTHARADHSLAVEVERAGVLPRTDEGPDDLETPSANRSSNSSR